MGIAVLAWLFVTVVIVLARILAKPVGYILAAMIMLPWLMFYIPYSFSEAFYKAHRFRSQQKLSNQKGA